MKKRLCFLTVLLPLFISCGWEIPEKISVKTDADYAFTVGGFEKQLSEYINVAEITEMVNSNGGGATGSEYAISVYDYNPGSKSNVQQFLIDVPLQDIPLDLDQYLDNLNFTDTLENISFEKVINTPDFTSQKIDAKVELPDIKTALFSVPMTASFDLTATGGIEATPLDDPVEIDVTVSGVNFDKLYFASGTIDFTVAKTSETNDFDFYITTVELYDKSSGTPVLISSTEHNKYVSNGKKIKLPVGEKAVSKELVLKLYGNQIDNEISGTISYGIAGTINSESKLSKVTGLSSTGISNFETTTESFSQTIRLDSSDADFISAEIGEGSIKIYSKLPDGWSGVTFTKTITVANPSVIDSEWDVTEETDAFLSNRTADIAGKVIEKGNNLEINGDFKFVLNDATILFNSSGELDPIPVSTDFKLLHLNYLIVDFSSYAENLSTSYSKDFPDSAKSFLDWIKIRPSGLKVKYTNNLPAGNDISMKVNSALMEIANVEKTLESETSGGSLTYYGDYEGASGIETIDEGSSSFDVKKIIPASDVIDVSVNIILPDAGDGNSNHAKLINIDLKKVYKIKVSVEPDFNWHSLCIKSTGDSGASFNGDISTEFGFDKLFGTVVDQFGGSSKDHFFRNLEFKSLPCYIYFVKPSGSSAFSGLFDDFNIEGKICLRTTNLDRYILGSASTTGTLMPKTMQVLEKDVNGTVISSLNANNSSANVDIKDLFKLGENNLSINYDMSLSTGDGEGIVIKRSDFEKYKAGESSSKTVSSIAIFARLAIPLSLNVLEDTNTTGQLDSKDSFVDLIRIAGMYEDDEGTVQKDFFGRSEKTDTDTFDKYAKIVKSVGLIYKIDNQLFSTRSYIDFNLGDAKKSNGQALDNSQYELNLKEGNMIVTKDDFMGWLSSYPLKPSVKVVIPKNSSINVTRNAKFGAGFSILLDCDGNQSFDIMGGE